MTRPIFLFFAFALAAILAMTGCGPSPNFSQYPGFESQRADLDKAPPLSADDRALLQKHKPQIFLPPNHGGLINFYRDYIAQGILRDGKGDIISDSVTPKILNEFRSDPAAVFEHIPQENSPQHPTAYGGLIRRIMSLPTAEGEINIRCIFLTYHFVFRHSGLPEGIPSWQRFLADLVGDSRDWHQLDHYTAATIALSEDDLRPFAVMLQQHNYIRTYIVGDDPAFPIDGAMKINAAMHSNELYPHRESRTARRAAGSISARTVGYLTGIAPPPMFRAAPDITEGKIEVDYQLEFLLPNDAFYVFEGRLGEHRLLPGRDGPPGAMYNNIPELRAPELAIAAFYWKDNDAEYARLFREHFKDWNSADGIPIAFRRRFAGDLLHFFPRLIADN